MENDPSTAAQPAPPFGSQSTLQPSAEPSGIIDFSGLGDTEQTTGDHTTHFEPYSKAPSAHEHEALLALEGMALGRHHVPNSPTRSNRGLGKCFLNPLRFGARGLTW